jgi:hypothetical protein
LEQKQQNRGTKKETNNSSTVDKKVKKDAEKKKENAARTKKANLDVLENEMVGENEETSVSMYEDEE